MTEGTPAMVRPGGPRRRFALALAALVVLLSLSVPPCPDDWDGIGFVASIARFDLDHFAPHPPGYPVYVALLRIASWIVPGHVRAANTVAVASAALGLAALAIAARKRFSAPGAALAVLAGTAAAPLVWRCSTAIGSEAPAFACAALALWGLSRRDPAGAAATGAFVGLGLGVRASWAPLFLPLLFLPGVGHRARAAGTALFATLAWAVPLIVVVGPSHLQKLLRTHLLGHASRWGGTALTDPPRLRFLLRDLFVDGMGVGPDRLGIAIAAVGAVTVVRATLTWRRHAWTGWGSAMLVLAPYLGWIAIGQNLRQQPRHALPLVVAFAAALAMAAVFDRRTRVPVMVMFALTALRTLGDARERRTIPPPGEQLVALVRALPDSSQVMVFGGPSVRFFEPTELASRAETVGSLGDVLVALGRVNRLPARVLVTSEVQVIDDPRFRLERLAVLSRPPRIDRRASSIDVFELHASFLVGK